MLTAESVQQKLRNIFNELDRENSNAQHVFTRLYRQTATQEALASDRRHSCSEAIGPLDGMIVSIKDLFDVKGEPTWAGGVADHCFSPAEADASVVHALRDAGAVIVGKTNMTEFAFSGLGLNPHYGTPANVLAPDRIPGGSSSGAAASVGLGLSELAIGSDTGGSVRIPAALNGLVGFKPGQQRISRDGAFPLSFTFDCVGFIAKDVQTVALAYHAIADDSIDADYTPRMPDLQLGVPRGLLFSGTDNVVGPSFDTGLSQLAAGGVSIFDVDLDHFWSAPFRLQEKGTMIGAEAAYIHRDGIGHPDRFDPFVLARLKKGQALDASTYVGIQQARTRLIDELDEAISGLDALVLPTVPIGAPKLSDLNTVEALDRTNALLLRNTSVFNFFDLPALSLPAPRTDRSIAVGAMIVVPRGKERRLLGIARTVQDLFKQQEGAAS